MCLDTYFTLDLNNWLIKSIARGSIALWAVWASLGFQINVLGVINEPWQLIESHAWFWKQNVKFKLNTIIVLKTILNCGIVLVNNVWEKIQKKMLIKMCIFCLRYRQKYILTNHIVHDIMKKKAFFGMWTLWLYWQMT